MRAAALGNTLAALVERDAEAYAACQRGVQAPKETRRARRAQAGEAIDEALLGAADVPLETARACAEVAELALAVAERGNTNAVSDAGVAALLAEAAASARATTCGSTSPRSATARAARSLARTRAQLVERARELARRTAEAVERALGAEEW